MSTPLAEYHLRTVPEYRLVTLRDPENDAGVDVGRVVRTAEREVAASTGYEIVVSCVQDLIPVDVTVAPYGSAPDSGSTNVVTGLVVECPSGQLVVGSPTGETIVASLPTGPGRYAAVVEYRGREQSRDQRQRLVDGLAAIEDLRTAANQYAGTERYVIRLWPTPINTND
jgi:hypothetical protein